MKKHLKVILTEMFSRVGKPLGDTKKTDWFHENSWTEQEEEDYINWLVKYLMDNKEARQELMQYPRKVKRDIIKVAKAFVWNYGWKIKD